MRKLLLSMMVLVALAAMAGCGPKLTDSERNAPPPAGPHGEKQAPPGAVTPSHGGNTK